MFLNLSNPPDTGESTEDEDAPRVFVMLDYDSSLYEPENPGDPVDTERMEADFRNEPTVLAIQELGFTLIEVYPVYSGLFELPSDWTIERALSELPRVFHDIISVEPDELVDLHSSSATGPEAEGSENGAGGQSPLSSDPI